MGLPTAGPTLSELVHVNGNGRTHSRTRERKHEPPSAEEMLQEILTLLRKRHTWTEEDRSAYNLGYQRGLKSNKALADMESKIAKAKAQGIAIGEYREQQRMKRARITA